MKKIIDCDGQKCDNSAVPCSLARQVIFSKDCEIKDLKGDIESAEKSGFLSALLVCLQVLHSFDQPTIAAEIVKATCTMKDIEFAAKNSGSEVDTDTLLWLKNNQ